MINKDCFDKKLSKRIALKFYEINIFQDSRHKKMLEKITPKNEIQKFTISNVKKNSEIASTKHIPLCQDTGMPVIFLEIPSNLCIKDDFEKMVGKEINEISMSKGLRLSIEDNNKKIENISNKPILHYIYSERKKKRVIIMAKGGGSENLSSFKMFNPSVQTKEIAEYVLEIIKQAGAKGCPPYTLGIGVGGSFEISALNSKLALTGFFNHNKKRIEKEISDYVMKKSKELKIGFLGLNFSDTVVECRVKYAPRHIATMPVSVSFNCYQERVGMIYYENL